MLTEYFEPIYFYHLAQELHKIKENLNSDDSAIERTIIDRVYYAIFLSYKQFLSKEKGFIPFNNGEDHGKILKFINTEQVFNNKSYNIASDIKEISDFRGFC